MTSPGPARIRAGMEVCDVGGDKIGSVAELHRFSRPPDPAAASVPDEILEVKTGLLGLGKRLYVPMSAVQEVLTESIFLSNSKEQFESLGYYERPVHLSQVD
jgi:hypothetical protein